MKADAFRAWLTEKYTTNSANTNFSFVRRVEDAYGDPDAAYEADHLASVVDALSYTSADAKLGRPNPTKLSINGNPYYVVSNARSALRTYVQFREQEVAAVSEVAVELAGKYLQERKEGKQFELERHLQEALRAEVGQLEVGLEIIDGGVERSVSSGSIDILARDGSGRTVVIELKRGEARREAIGQILGYMGDLKSDEPDAEIRGILVAGDFDKSCRSSVLVVPGITLKRNRFAFSFDDIG